MLNGMHTQLGIISIPLFIDLVGTGSKSSNNVHHANFLFACYIFSSRIILHSAPSLTQTLPLVLLSLHILPYTVLDSYFSRPSYHPTQHHTISKTPRPTPPLSHTTPPTQHLTYRPARPILQTHTQTFPTSKPKSKPRPNKSLKPPAHHPRHSFSKRKNKNKITTHSIHPTTQHASQN